MDDPYLYTDTARRVKWDGGTYYRDLWQWDFTKSAGYQCKTYDFKGNRATVYDEPPAADMSLNVTNAWSATRGSGITVAIADSGCDTNHPDLRNRIIGGIAVAGSAGWSTDSTGHGTALASVVAAEGNNGLGVVGIAPEVSLYIIKCPYQSLSVRWAVDAAIAAGASVLVMSWGFANSDTTAKAALVKAGENGIAVVCAAMNANIDEGSQADYPIQWQLPNVVAVSSSTMNDVPYAVSATSKTLVHLHAPGRLIAVSRFGTTDYVYTSGTSFANAKVAGTLALIQAAHPELSLESRIYSLLASVDKIPAYAGKSITGGRLNCGWAVLGPEQSIEITNGIPTIMLNGPAFATFSVSVSHDLINWQSMPTVQGDIAGRATIVSPLQDRGFFRTSIVRPASENMVPSAYARPLKLDGTPRPPVTVSEP